MLEAIHKYAHYPVFKVIFGLLILAFAISGISGMKALQGAGGNDYLAKVGSEKITAQTVDLRYTQMLRAMGPQVLQMKEDQLEGLGVSRNEVLKNLIQGALVRQEAEKIGIEVGEASIKKQISKMPVFANEKGMFDPQRFMTFLQKMNMTEHQLQSDMKNDLRNLILASAVMNNTPKNVYLAEEIAKAIKVTRDIEVIKIPASHVKIAATPSDEELNKFYFENSYKYQSAETRNISYINIPKPAENDKAAYDKITKLEDEIAGGSNLEEIATKLGLQVQKANNVQKSQIKLNQLAFATKQGQLSPATQNEDGSYVVLQVDEISEKKTPDIATVKPTVIADWRVKKQSDENIKFSQGIVAELKDGKDLAKLAAEKGLPYEKLNNFSSEDKRFGEEFILSVFNAGSGKITNSVPNSEGGYLIAKVNAVKENPVTADEINQALQQGAQIFQQELFSQYMKYLEKKYPVVINQQALNPKKQPAPKNADKNADPA